MSTTRLEAFSDGVQALSATTGTSLLTGIVLAFVSPLLALVPYVAVALMWLVPDRRVERFLASEGTLAGPGRP